MPFNTMLLPVCFTHLCYTYNNRLKPSKKSKDSYKIGGKKQRTIKNEVGNKSNKG